MSPSLQLEAAASHCIARLLQWPSALRLLSADALTQRTSSPSACGDRSGWAIVPVLNELLDRTAPLDAELTRFSPTTTTTTTTTTSSASPGLGPRHRKRQRSICINCRRVFSTTHDAASRPVDGFCSVDCRASHTYMDAIASDTDTKLKPFVSGTSPTLDCDDSCFSPLTPMLRGRHGNDCHFLTMRAPQGTEPVIIARP